MAVKHLHAVKQLVAGNPVALKTTKLHLATHSHIWVQEFGAMTGFDTSRWESFMQVAAKQPFRRSKKSVEGSEEAMLTRVRSGTLLHITAHNLIYLPFLAPVPAWSRHSRSNPSSSVCRGTVAASGGGG